MAINRPSSVRRESHRTAAGFAEGLIFVILKHEFEVIRRESMLGNVFDVAADVVHPDEFKPCHSRFLSCDLIRIAEVVKYYNPREHS